MGRIERGGGDGGEPARCPQSWLSFRRLEDIRPADDPEIVRSVLRFMRTCGVRTSTRSRTEDHFCRTEKAIASAHAVNHLESH